MDERLRFIARLLEGEAMSDVCREFGVSRKPGYKIFDRYKEHGLEALSDRSSCTMIMGISIWSRKLCSPLTTRSARGCHPCLRYNLLPMSPGRTHNSYGGGSVRLNSISLKITPSHI
jgi:Helix-turn-helix domain